MPSAQKPFMVMRCPPLPTVQFTLPHISQKTEFMKLSCPSKGLTGAKDPKQTRMTVRKDPSDSVLHFRFNLPAYCPFCTVLHVLGAEGVIKGKQIGSCSLQEFGVRMGSYSETLASCWFPGQLRELPQGLHLLYVQIQQPRHGSGASDRRKADP